MLPSAPGITPELSAVGSLNSDIARAWSWFHTKELKLTQNELDQSITDLRALGGI